MSADAESLLTPRRLLRCIVDFVYPPVCAVCRVSFESEDDVTWICPRCRAGLQLLPFPLCPICRHERREPERLCTNCHRRAHLAWVYPLGFYDDNFAHLIKAFKYNDRIEVGRRLGDLLGQQLRSFRQTEAIEVVVCVPLHRRKRARRGFSQTAILAEQVARAIDRPLATDALIQIRANRDQIGLTVEQRFANVRDVFVVAKPESVKGKFVLLIDDVTTSGATLNAAATVLINAGARMVVAATAAMALEDGLDPALLYEFLAQEF